MTTYQATYQLKGGQITAMQGPRVILDDSKEPINVGHDWMSHASPRVGDYLVRVGHYGWELRRKSEFEARYKPLKDPSPGVITGQVQAKTPESDERPPSEANP